MITIQLDRDQLDLLVNTMAQALIEKELETRTSTGARHGRLERELEALDDLVDELNSYTVEDGR